MAAEYYDSFRHPTCANFREASSLIVDQCLDELPISGGLSWEVGAGKSLVAECLKRKGKDLSALVISDAHNQMLSYSAGYRADGAKLVISEATKIPLHSESASVLVSILGDPYNSAEFWLETRRILKFGGKCLFTTPSFEWASCFRSFSRNEEPGFAYFELANQDSVLLPSSILNKEEQLALISNAGLCVKSIYQPSLRELRLPVSPKLTRLTDASLGGPVTGYLVEKH